MNYYQFMGALFLWRECQGQPLRVKQAVWSVVLNRAQDPCNRWGQTVVDVVLAMEVFSWTSVRSAMFPVDSDAKGWAEWKDCENVVGVGAMDCTDGALHYSKHSLQLELSAHGLYKDVTLTVGEYVFYKMSEVPSRATLISHPA